MLCVGCCWLDFFDEIFLKNFTSDTKDLWCRWVLVSISLKLNPLFLLSSSLSNKSKFSLDSFFFCDCWLEFELNESSDDEKLYRESWRLPDSFDEDEDDDCISLNSMSKSKSAFCSTVDSSNCSLTLIKFVFTCYGFILSIRCERPTWRKMFLSLHLDRETHEKILSIKSLQESNK